jgi:putative FmdB family regulatory protein
MPTYDYVCTACAHEFETFQSIKSDALKDCPACHKPKLKRKIGLGAGIIFKGGGFYETDYRRVNNSAKNEGATSEKATAESSKPGSSEPAKNNSQSSNPASSSTSAKTTA